jgi:hypothetical protein
LISGAKAAEVSFAAFRGRRHRFDDQVAGRLIVRRVRWLNPPPEAGQEELFPGCRHHAIFTDSALPMLQAEAHHRGHAAIEQVFADLKAGPLAHLPSGRFAANSAWLVLAAIALSLTRTAGALASLWHAKATTGAIRRQLIMVPGRLAHTARQVVLHLPDHWPWQPAWQQLFTQACGPPPPPRPDHQAVTARPRTSRGEAGQTGEPPTPASARWQHQDHQPIRRTDNRGSRLSTKNVTAGAR